MQTTKQTTSKQTYEQKQYSLDQFYDSEQLNQLFMSPLHDPVIGAIFSNVEHAGLAAKSLVGSILAEDFIIEEIIEVTPQTYYKTYPDKRGARVDIYLRTADGKRFIVEIQISPEPILERNLFAVSHTILSNMQTGTDSKDFDDTLPTIIVINILNFELRKGHADFLQPVGLLYTKEPHEVADEHIRIYNVQLPVFRKQEHDLTKPLDAWLYLLDTAHQLKKPINEVIEMDSRLKETINLDAGMKQFTEEYERVTADPKLRDEHAMYIMECMRQNGMKRMAKQEGLEQGREEAREEARIAMLSVVKNLLALNIPPEQVSQATGLPIEEIKDLIKSIVGIYLTKPNTRCMLRT